MFRSSAVFRAFLFMRCEHEMETLKILPSRRRILSNERAAENGNGCNVMDGTLPESFRFQ